MGKARSNLRASWRQAPFQHGTMREGVSEFLAENLVLQLAQARKAQGLSINKLAWMSGVSPKAISFIEQGVHSPTLKTFFRLSVALELNLPQVFQQIMDTAKVNDGLNKEDSSPE